METGTSGKPTKDSAAAPNTPGGGATALFPCLVYYPNNNNYSLIWVPMDGSNPAISQAAAAAGGPSFQLPVQVGVEGGWGGGYFNREAGFRGVFYSPTHTI